MRFMLTRTESVRYDYLKLVNVLTCRGERRIGPSNHIGGENYVLSAMRKRNSGRLQILYQLWCAGSRNRESAGIGEHRIYSTGKQ